MRKIVSIIAALCIVATTLFAVSYTNNTFHKLAEEYTEKAQKALDAGYYELAEEYAAEAKKNAALSEEFIANMIAKSEAEEAIAGAKKRLNTALESGVDPNSKEYTNALACLNKAQTEYENEEYPEAKADAEKVKEILSDDFIKSVVAEKAAKDAAQEALNKAQEAVKNAEEAGVPADSEEMKKAKDYLAQAQKDFDDGNYDSAKANAEKVLDVLDGDAVKNVLAKKAAEDALAKAKEALENAKKAGLDEDYPLYKEAKDAYDQAQKDYDEGKYPESKANADKVVELLSQDNVDDQLSKAKAEAEEALAKAKAILDKADEAGIDKENPDYKKALDYYNKAKDELDNQEYKPAKADAEKVAEILNDELINKLKEEQAAEKALEEAKKAEEQAAAEAKKAAEDALAKAKEALENAKKAGLDEDYPLYKEAKDAYDQAQKDYDEGKYPESKANADKVVELLSQDNVDDQLSKAKAEAEKALAKAKAILDKADEAGIDKENPVYKKALDYYSKALAEYNNKEYKPAKADADKVAEILTDEVVDTLKAEAAAAKALEEAKKAEEDAKRAEEEAKKAAEQALSEAKNNAAEAIAKAKERLDYARSAGLDETNEQFKAAQDYYNQAVEDFDNADYESAKDNAEQVLALLPVEDIDAIVNAAKVAAEESLAKAKDALDAAKEAGISPLNEDFQTAVQLYADAKKAYDDGDYETAKTLADQVLELLDPETVKDMKAKADAEAAISKARERIIAANAAGLDTSYEPYKEALSFYKDAQKEFADEDYVAAKESADKVADLLSDEAIDEILEKAEALKAKSAAEGALNAAKERLDYAESLGLDTSDPKFNAALAYYNRATDEFESENYPECIDDANAVLSALDDSYLNNLIARRDAEKAIAAAKERLEYAESINAPRDFPIAYDAAKAYLAQALDDYTAEQYEKAIADANKAIDALADIHEMVVLPKFYIVRPWAESKDCFWNISGRSYVYNNPWLWENLYEANKDNIPERDNPNLILPGMKMEIPSISGEYRDGVYSPDVEYGTFSANR